MTLVGLSLVISIAAWALDRYGRKRPDAGAFDAIVVLGCRVHPDGTASTALRERTRRAVELWREGRAPVIVLTGGIGDNPPSEARAAADLARDLGVPESALLLEDRSRSTEDNARFTYERFGGHRILLVSDAYHVFRAERVFGQFYEDVHGTGSLTNLRTRLHGAFREVAACAIYWALGRLGHGPVGSPVRSAGSKPRKRPIALVEPCLSDLTDGRRRFERM